MSDERSWPIRPFVYTVIEDDGINVTIEIAVEEYLADLATGCDEDETMSLAATCSSEVAFWRDTPS